MSIENVGSESTAKLTWQQGLAMPFLDKNIKINAHVGDEVGEMKSSYSLEDFKENVNDSKWSVSKEISEIKAIELNEQLTYDIGVVSDISDMQKNSSISYFQSSTLLDGKDMVYEALRNGYPADRAIVVGKAHEVYSATAAKDNVIKPINNLINKEAQTKKA